MNRTRHALALYLDTSAIGGYFDAEFLTATRALWRLKEAGRYRFVSSVLVEQEIAGAPERVRELMRTTFAPADTLPMTVEAVELAGHYLGSKNGVRLWGLGCFDAFSNRSVFERRTDATGLRGRSTRRFRRGIFERRVGGLAPGQSGSRSIRLQ